MQPTEQHRNGVALSYHETRGECSHTHGRSIRVSSGNLADRRGFIVRLPAAALGDNGAAAAVLVSSARGTAFRLTRCERRACLVRLPEHAAAYGDDAAAAAVLAFSDPGTDGEAFLLKRCERRGFIVRLPAAA